MVTTEDQNKRQKSIPVGCIPIATVAPTPKVGGGSRIYPALWVYPTQSWVYPNPLGIPYILSGIPYTPLGATELHPYPQKGPGTKDTLPP